MKQHRPVIIFLNGASSSSKTSTALALKNLFGANCVFTGLDDILQRVKPFGTDGGTFANVQRSLRIIWFQLTDGRLRLFKILHREVVSQYHSGHDVIVETALMDKCALQDAAECFAPLNAYLVAMRPPLSVSEKWEAARHDRPRGQARKHYELIHAHGINDLMLNPSNMTPEQCATAIAQLLESTPPIAFSKLRESI